MKKDQQRIRWIQSALARSGLDALLVALPSNVLLLTGYFPVLGTAVALITSDGEIGLVAPEDEERFWLPARPIEVRPFKTASLHEIKPLLEAVSKPLKEVAEALAFKGRCAVGIETTPAHQPLPYAAVNVYGAATRDLATTAIPGARVAPADGMLRDLRGRLTASELGQIRRACGIAAKAFKEGLPVLGRGISEVAAASAFTAGLSQPDSEEVKRAYGFAWCMSGPNSAEAHGAYACSTLRRLTDDDLILVHCNSCADGFWTDITRTFHFGDPDERMVSIYEAIFAARKAALDVARPGITGAVVDHAARQILKDCGYETEFKHAAGHGVGYAAVDHGARPRIHPLSEDVLETGMVFNLEPAVYISGWGGVRHCDMVAVTDSGAEVLTPFLCDWKTMLGIKPQ